MTVEVASGAQAGRAGYRELLIEELNRKLRRPAEYGGAAELSLLLDELAWVETGERGVVWLTDSVQRFHHFLLLREFDNADGHVLASQYGEDAHRRGWLRPDRTLSVEEHAAVQADLAAWRPVTDLVIDQVTGRYGEPSVVFGDPDPLRPKTLAYVSGGQDAEFITLVFGEEGVLLGFSYEGGFFGCEVTPHGELVWNQG